MKEFRHVIKAQQFDRSFLDRLFSEASAIKSSFRGASHAALAGKIMATFFYEPSTRTRLSFETAMLRLGGQVISTENAREYSSVAKGETLEDSIRTIACYADVIVLRHDQEGAAERAAAVSRVPVINAGDGAGQHPTQALLDLFTIKEEMGTIDGLCVACVGDLAHGRTVRSLVYLLAKFEVKKFIFVAPEAVRMKDDIKDYLTRHGTAFSEETDLAVVARQADIIYQTRIQKERFGSRFDEYERSRGYVIDSSIMSLMKAKSIVMHPFPRVDEIDSVVDEDPRAAYFRQIENGIPVRMALLTMLLRDED